MLARSVVEVRPQAGAAACAASSAFSTSSAVERATEQITCPLMGETLSKYCPRTGAMDLPPMKLPYCFFTSQRASAA